MNEKMETASLSETEVASADHLYSFLCEDILGLRFESAQPKKGKEAELMDLIISLRNKFRDQKDWEAADLIREGLNKIGITLEDTKDGTGWRKE
ncbi:MAG: hypothetical protein P8078_13340 [bacterium]